LRLIKILNINLEILNLCKKTEDLRLNLRKKKIDEKLLDIMEKKYDQAKKINSLSTKLDELILPDDVKYKSFTDDVILINYLNFYKNIILVRFFIFCESFTR